MRTEPNTTWHNWRIEADTTLLAMTMLEAVRSLPPQKEKKKILKKKWIPAFGIRRLRQLRTEPNTRWHNWRIKADTTLLAMRMLEVVRFPSLPKRKKINLKKKRISAFGIRRLRQMWTEPNTRWHNRRMNAHTTLLAMRMLEAVRSPPPHTQKKKKY